jgi:tetrahydromethanopterin S-methyltransferase subunit E
MDNVPACKKLGGFLISLCLSMLVFISFTEKCRKEDVSVGLRMVATIFAPVQAALFLSATPVPGNRMARGPF